MASAPVLGAKRAVTLDGEAFGARFNGPLVHESVRAELAARRRGSASTKTRGLVRGGGAKPWRQKGTGRARAGSNRSPVWTGGGVVFGPHPRSYTFKVNRKERRAALRSALSLHAERESLALFDTAAFSAPSTRAAAALLGAWTQPRPTLVVVVGDEGAAALSFRNIARVSVLEADSVGIADIVGAASLLCSEAGLAALTARAAAPGAAGAAGAAADAASSSPAAKASVAAKPAAAQAATPEAATAKAASAAKPAAAKTAAKPVAKPKPPAAKPKAAAKPRAAKPAAPAARGGKAATDEDGAR
ncbi:MAG: 50S ribosomal protein L4 [Solirubrobacteraceae bacterium]|jgi:large subunit ribosomal protein L4